MIDEQKGQGQFYGQHIFANGFFWGEEESQLSFVMVEGKE